MKTPESIKPDEYPPWICVTCGDKFGEMPDSHTATWHVDECGWCGKNLPVTEPRDFRYPAPPGNVPVL